MLNLSDNDMKELEEFLRGPTSNSSDIEPPLLPGNEHLLALGPQAVIDVAVPILRRDLFAPLGLVPEQVPIFVDDRLNLWGRALGETRFRGSNLRPLEIAVIDPFRVHDLRPGGGEFFPTFDFVGVLAHELVHASIWRNKEENLEHNGHGPTFERYMREIGLVEPSITGGHSGPKFRDWYVKNILPALDAKLLELRNERAAS